jgi:hypothetical protein
MHSDPWQKNCTHWQSQFIHHNSLMLGYLAWHGYLQHRQGLLVCDVTDLSGIDWNVDSVAFAQCFVAQPQVTGYLQNLKLEQSVIEVVSGAIAAYNPTTAIVLLIHASQAVEIDLLQNLAISPPQCYQQVKRRWAEFQPSFTQEKLHD